MKIKIRPGSRSSIESAIDRLKERERFYQERIDVLVEKLAEVGRRKAEEVFATAEYDGAKDITVTTEKTETGWRIAANGESVAFVEFGTGITQPDYPADAKVTHEHGTFGQGKGANPNGWVYYGEPGSSGRPIYDRNGNQKEGVYRTMGNPPAMAMYLAVREMRDAVGTLAKEVFR